MRANIVSFLWIILQNIQCLAFTSYYHYPITSPIHGNSKKKIRQSQILPGFQLNGLFGAGNTADLTKQEDPVEPNRIIDIACDSIKEGALRFTLSMYLIGQQNTPTKSSWTVNQADDGSLNMYYIDKTAMFSVKVSDNLIAVDRYGPSPSLRYMLQESVLLHGFLDEVESLAMGSGDGDDEIKDENRLLLFSKPNTAVQNAREILPARPAEK